MNSRKAFEQAAKHQEIGPYSEYATAQEKAMKLKLQGAKSIRIDKKKGEWVISFVGESTMGNPRKAFEQALGQVRPEDRQNPRIAFEQALMQRLAIEFPTEEALKKYLEKHPGADKAKHTVSESSIKKPSKKEPDYQESEAYKTSKKDDYYPQKAPKGMKYPNEMNELPKDLRDNVMSMFEEDLGKEESYKHSAIKKLKKTILKRLKNKEEQKEVEKEVKLLFDLKSKLFNKQQRAESDAEADPYRFGVRKLYHAWQAYNDAFQEAR
jgi:hypothetical protein